MTERLTHPQGGGGGQSVQEKSRDQEGQRSRMALLREHGALPRAAGQDDRKRGTSQKSEVGARPQGSSALTSEPWQEDENAWT